MDTQRGLIISFEGIDGCGKTTQARLFFEYLNGMEPDVVLLNEPGSTGIGDRIRESLLDKNGHLVPWCELLLYLASRAQLVEEKIAPAVMRGGIVVLDRYVDSTAAYQGYGRGLPLDFIRESHRRYVGPMMPDLTFLIDEEPSYLAGVLSGKEKDRMESESIDFQKRVREGFLAIGREEPGRVKVIKRQDVESTFAGILNVWGRFRDEFIRS